MLPLRQLLSATFVLACLLFGACSTAKDWQELQVGPQTFADVYDGVQEIADSGGFVPSAGDCDRGLGVWQSRWRMRVLDAIGHPGRQRLHVEIKDGAPDTGWLIRFYVEQQKVKDLRKSMGPSEDDWSRDGQDSETEDLYGQRLARRLRRSQPRASGGQ
jgi:hypothetical protein